MEFDKTRWYYPWNIDQNCTQNSTRGAGDKGGLGGGRCGCRCVGVVGVLGDGVCGLVEVFGSRDGGSGVGWGGVVWCDAGSLEVEHLGW